MAFLMNLKHEFYVLFYHIGIALHRLIRTPYATVMESLTMTMSNFFFFLTWVLIFQIVPHVKGWNLSDVAMMYSLGAACFGTAGVFFGGYRTIISDIDSGKFDSYLCKPASPLSLSLTSHSAASGIGEILTVPLFWFVFCHLTIWQMAFLALMIIPGAIIMTAIGVMIYSMAFWTRSAQGTADTILWGAITFLTTPLHGLPIWAKWIVLTAFPVGCIAYLPIEIVHHPSIWAFCGILAAAIWSVILARGIFYMGLRQYKGASSIQTGH